MPDVLSPMNGVNLPAFLAKQDYKIPTLSQTMFSSPKEAKAFKVMLQPTVLQGLSIQRLWDGVFAEGCDFLKRYHDTRGELDLNVGKWEFAPDMGSGYRFVTLLTIVEVPRKGSKTVLNEAHRFAYGTTDAGGVQLYYQISSQTPNVPSGTSFRTEANLVISADSPSAQCTIEIFGNCKKMSWVFTAIQGIATPRAIREMTAGYTAMVRMFSRELCEGDVMIDGSEDSVTKQVTMTVVPSDAGEAAQPADEAPGMAFQGVLLVLAFFITVVLLWSMSTIRGTSHQTLAFMRSVTDQFSQHSRSVGGSAAEASPASISVDQALIHAAREAEVQTLRYRWQEQQREISALQKSINWLWWMGLAQVVGLVCLCIKMFM